MRCIDVSWGVSFLLSYWFVAELYIEEPPESWVYMSFNLQEIPKKWRAQKDGLIQDRLTLIWFCNLTIQYEDGQDRVSEE